MSNFRGVWLTLLDAAIAAGRATLRDLDVREVPAGLQRVAAYTGGNLPPPLASSLLAEIDGNEWFRLKVVDDWEGDPASPPGLFLVRPDGWWVDLAAAAATVAGTGERAQLADLEKQVAKMEDKWRRATDKVTEQKAQIETERKQHRAKVESARDAATTRFEAEVEGLKTARVKAEALTVELGRLRQEHLDLQEAFAGLRSRFAKTRRLREDPSGGTGTSGSIPSDPVKLARMLDLQTASFGRTPQATPRVERKPAPVLSLSPGVRPDSADAIRWLLGLADPVVVLIDGYNAQFHIDRNDFTSGAARSNLVAALRRLRAAGKARHRIVAVFDSTLPGDRVPRASSGGVEVRFTEKDVIADEEIVTMAGRLDEVVVISSDREVREGSEDVGAVVLWSEALAEWLERG